MEGWTIRVLSASGAGARVAPIELWDLPCEGAPLYRRVGSERAAALRARGVREEAIGAELGSALGATLAELSRAEPFDRVRLDGGLAQLPGLARATSRALGRPVVRGRGGTFAGELGARRLLRARGLEGGVVLDVGQTGLALSRLAPGRRPWRRTLARDLARLPLARVEEPAPSEGARAASYAALVAWIGEALGRALAPGTPRVVVLALPAELAADGTPGPCTYAGLAGRRELAQDMLSAAAPRARAGEGGLVLLLNDAVLAAHAARPLPGERWLSVTLGFGPGGALVRGPCRAAPVRP